MDAGSGVGADYAQVTFEWTGRECVSLLRWQMIHRLHRPLALLGVGLGLGIWIAADARSGVFGLYTSTTIWAAVVLSTLATTALYVASIAWRMPQITAQRAALMGPHRWCSVSAEGIAVGATFGDGRTRWAAIDQVEEAKDWYWIRQKSGGYALLVPRRAFSGPQDEQLFRTIVSGNVTLSGPG